MAALDAAFLRQALLFAGLGEEELGQLCALAVPVSVEAGGHIFAEGDEARGLYLVESGAVKVYKLSALSPARLLFFPKQSFLAAIAAQPALALNMIGALALRLRGCAAWCRHGRACRASRARPRQS